jgi:HAD superfamily hydrolase (TIGR01549 family)
MPRPFDLITFDFDGVLLHSNFFDLYLAQCRAMGMQWAQENEAKLARFIHDYYAGSLYLSDMEAHGREKYFPVANRRFLKALGVEGEWDEQIPALTEQVRAAEVVYYYESRIHDLLEGLREEGYRLAMLTNRDDRIHEFGAEWGMIEPFELIITTSTTGKHKPEPAGFLYANDYFNVPPSRSLHIGDNPYADVRGAEAAGWSALLVDPDDLFPDWEVARVRSLSELPDWLASQNGR